jgi:hypothetical protein
VAFPVYLPKPTSCHTKLKVCRPPLFQTLFDEMVEPLLVDFVAGKNACLLLVGESGSGKQYSLSGPRGAGGGVFELVAQGLFSRGLSPSAKVTVSCWELQNELVNDLMRPESEPLAVLSDPESGMRIEGLTSKEVHNDKECIRAFRESLGNRNEAMTTYGPISARATVATTLALDDGAGVASTFVFVNVAAAEALLEDPMETRMKDGPNLNKSLTALYQLVETLSSSGGPVKAAEAPYSASKLTRILQEGQ